MVVLVTGSTFVELNVCRGEHAPRPRAGPAVPSLPRADVPVVRDRLALLRASLLIAQKIAVRLTRAFEGTLLNIDVTMGPVNAAVLVMTIEMSSAAAFIKRDSTADRRRNIVHINE